MTKHTITTSLCLSVLVTVLLLSRLELSAMAAPNQTVPVTVTISRLIEIDNPDDEFFAFHGDYYAEVRINGFTFQQSSEVSYDPGFGEGIIYTLPLVFNPFWTFTRDVDASLGTIPIEIQLWDRDSGSPDDQIDINPIAGVRNLVLFLDLNTGSWSGDVPTNQTFSQGGGDSDKSKIFFDITTLSSSGDADGDGLLDGWETRGLDADGDGTIDVNLPGFGANPQHKDLFLEFDWVTGQEPTQTAIQTLKAAFAAAPINAGGINNPDGLPGINLWVDTGNLVDANAGEDGRAPGSCGDGVDNGGDGLVDGNDPDCLVGDNLGGGNAVPDNQINNLDANFYTTKRANFDAAHRSWIFRYGISGNPAHSAWGGQGEIGGNDFVEYNHDAGTIMHEFGHNLHLRHGGDVNDNCKPNYVSVMNYDLQFGIPQAGGGSIIDYSPPRLAGGRGIAPLPTLRENNLDEATILDGTDAANRFVFVNGIGQRIQNQLNQAVDWNGDGDTNDSGLTVNIDTAACTNNVSNSVLTGFDDWTNIAMAFRQFGDSDDGAINPVAERELTLQELLDLQQELNTTDVGITISDSPDPAAAGATLTYTLSVTNRGPNPASQVRVVDTLPDGVRQVSNSAGCVEAPVGTLTCDLGELLAGQSQAITITVLIDASLVYNAGGPTTITDSATVENLAGPDPSLGNNSASEATQVIAVADLGIVSFEALNPPEALLVGEQVSTTLRKIITDYGPSAPVDVELARIATASPGSTITPGTSSSSELALGLNEQRTVDEIFTVQCQQPGFHTFTVTNEIRPLGAQADTQRQLMTHGNIPINSYDPASQTGIFKVYLSLVSLNSIAGTRSSTDLATDPNPANNQAMATFVVECVIPVAINIKPGSDVNPINLNAGAIPLAVLTTQVGEYGLPLDFDATTIDPLSVRFGPRDLVWPGSGGAPEEHARGHPEDSYELDEITQDGDIDMVLHFEASQTGIGLGDTEACVKGIWTDTGGNQFKFFGCDMIVIRPDVR